MAFGRLVAVVLIVAMTSRGVSEARHSSGSTSTTSGSSCRSTGRQSSTSTHPFRRWLRCVVRTLDVDPEARFDRQAFRRLYEGPGVTVRELSTYRRHGRRFVHIRLDVSDIGELPRLAPLSWSRYRLQRLENEFRFVQEVGPAAQRANRRCRMDGRRARRVQSAFAEQDYLSQCAADGARKHPRLGTETSGSPGRHATAHGSADGNPVDSLPHALAVRRHIRDGDGGARPYHLVGRSEGKERGSRMSSSFGAKPAVLRCSRCGTFVDWAEARAQVVCECRPRIELPPVLVREAADVGSGRRARTVPSRLRAKRHRRLRSADGSRCGSDDRCRDERRDRRRARLPPGRRGPSHRRARDRSHVAAIGRRRVSRR